MVNLCCVYGCTKGAVEGVRSLHQFPKDRQTLSAWKRFVKRTRADWKSPTHSDRICSDHFVPDAYENYMKWSMRMTKMLELKEHRVPTKYPPGTCSTLSSARHTSKNLGEGGSTEAAVGSPSSTSPRKKRRAIAKREVNRLLESATHAVDEVTDNAGALLDHPVEMEPEPAHKDASTQYEPQPGATRTMKIQANFKPRKPQYRSKYSQAEPSTSAVGVGCHLIGPKSLRSTPVSSDAESSSEEEELDISDIDMYDPEDEEMSFEETCATTRDLAREEKFIVFRSSLWELFSKCPVCSSQCAVEELFRKGSKVVVSQTCTCGYERTWSSQPSYGDLPAGNIQLSAAILFTGSSPTKVLRTLRALNIVCISAATYQAHLTKYLQPTVCHQWGAEQQGLLHQLAGMEGGLVLGGDGRSDSPGHCAKYGSYSMIEERINKVVDIQLVQSNEVANSVAMEKEGLIRSVQHLKDSGVDLSAIVTDRHPQIQKWLRESLSETKHYYDVWHVAKGVTKKVTSLAKQDKCEDIRPWIKSISNHLYWCASSTPDGDSATMVGKWKSLGNHVQNVHHSHGQDFPDCTHGELRIAGRKKKWLQPNSKSCEKLVQIIDNTRLCNDVKKLSPLHQTSNVESFHSLILHFCPKMTAFSYKGMLCRLYLAALHYNANSNRPAATTKSGEVLYAVKYPKFKKGGYTLRERKTTATYEYVASLMKLLCDKVVACPDEFAPAVDHIQIPSFLSSQFQRPDLKEAITQHTTRFNPTRAT